MSAPIVGIDLGTTYSLVAVLDGGIPRVLPNAVGEHLTPSAVSIGRDGAILVGAPARARATTDPERTALSFKRDMGTDAKRTLGNRAFTAPELSALVLAALKKDAEAALGTEIVEAVVTVPAYFGEAQRQATRDAGTIAGLRVERIINEPTAAALAYGLHERHREMRAVVLDLGGGTFDVTVLEIMEGVIEIRSSAGNARLGGDDFDRALAVAIRDKALAAGVRLADSSMPRLLAEAERAKKRLGASRSTSVALVDAPVEGGKTQSFEIAMTREEAEDAWRGLLDDVRAPVVRALRDAEMPASRIDEVLLVGGSTRMPCVVELAAKLFGKLPARALPPDEAVALGAAVQAALKAGDASVEDLVVTDVAPFSLGIATAETFGAEIVPGMFTPVLERGTVIPASRSRRFHTVHPNQREIKVEVYQGEHASCRDNTFLGEYSVRGLPARREGDVSVEIRFSYDLNGLLEVDTTVEATGAKSSLLIERQPGRLSKTQIEDARRALAKLKTHPRDLLPNATALERAEAAYVELTGDARLELGVHIARFRAALETQNEGVIAEARSILVARTRALRDGAM